MKKQCEWCGSKIPEAFHNHADCPGTYKGAEQVAAMARWNSEIERRRAALKPRSAYPHIL